jgi:hypothetical protein
MLVQAIYIDASRTLPIGWRLGNAHQAMDRNEIVQSCVPLRRGMSCRPYAY